MRAAEEPSYPSWVLLLLNSAAVATAIASVAQRSGSGLVVATLLMALALAPFLVELTGRVLPWPLATAVTLVPSATLMVLHPIDYDFVPFMLVLLVGCVGAYRSMAASGSVLVIVLVALAALAAAGPLPVAGMAIWFAAVVIAWDAGFILRAQQLRLERQEQEYADRSRQAALEERQRIAREVHDLVAHSLSVTMLHLTAARRDLEDDGDVAEAVEALTEAERVGRQAMADIRRTVGMLGAEPVAVAPTPVLADVSGLVEEFRTAGLDVELTVRGEVDAVAPSAALGLYRIVQESLANVAKHAPTAPARVVLDLETDPARLVVSNPVPAGHRTRPGGSGLRGMAERAELLGVRLRAGPESGSWVVAVELPRERVCPLPRLALVLRRPVVEPT